MKLRLSVLTSVVRNWKSIWGLLTLMFLFHQDAQAQTVLMRDDFNNRFDTNNDLNPSKWKVFGEDLAYARTQFGNKPTIATDADGTSFAHLKLSTYNYNSHPTYTIKGTEIASSLFARESGKEFEARVRCRNLNPGIVGAFWAFGEQGQWGTTTYKKDETDIEFLSNSARNTLLLTTWNDWNPQAGYAFNDGIHHSDRVITVGGLDWGTWRTYKIRWLPDRTEWYVDGYLVNSSTAANPDDSMAVRFNIWAPDQTWPDAYSATLFPTTDASASVNYFLDVDWVEVRDIPPTVSSTGTGLSATYFDNKDLTGPSLTRLDPQIDFNWGEGSPATGIASDTFSVIWTGQVEPRYTQTYTFSTVSDDGVRLWVDGKLLIDRWNDQGPTEWSGTIDLIAGLKYAIKMEYYENNLGACARLLWSSASTPKAIIPKSQLYPATGVTPTPTPTATTAPTPTPTTKPTAIPTATPTPVPTTKPTPIATGTPTPTPTVMPPSAPTSLTATPVSSSQINLTWTDTASNESGFRIEYSTNGTTFVQFATTGANIKTFSHSSLAASTTYYYRVRAYNAGGNSAFSNVSSAKTASAPTSGTGLTGQYFDNSDLTNLKLTRTDATVNFNWNEGSPDATISPETFSVRWTGFVQPTYTQSYTFTTKSDDGVRLWINNQLVIDRWVNQASTEVQSTPLSLNAGQKYSIRMEYFDNTLGADASLSWSSTSQPKQIIPRERLYPQ